MTQYIDKDALLAEIEKLYAEHSSKHYIDEAGVVLDQLENFLDTLEVKEVDLEKELEDWLGERVGKWTGKECERMCHHFFELGLKAQKGE